MSDKNRLKDQAAVHFGNGESIEGVAFVMGVTKKTARRWHRFYLRTAKPVAAKPVETAKSVKMRKVTSFAA